MLLAEAPKPVRLVATVDDCDYFEFDVVGHDIVARDGDGRSLSREQTFWRLEGDLTQGAHAISLAPAYQIIQRELLPLSEKAVIASYAVVIVWRGWPWRENDLIGSTIVITWLVDGRSTQVQAMPAFVRGEASRSIAAIAAFELAADTESGSPAVLVLKDGKFIVPKPVFSVRDAENFLREMYLGDGSSPSMAVADLQKPDVRSEHLGCMLLHLAAQDGRVHAVHRLLNLGADPRALDRAEATPLHRSAAYGRTKATAALVAGGARPNAVDKSGKRPVELATDFGHLEGIDDLIYEKIPPECVIPTFRSAARRCDRALLEQLLVHGGGRLVRKLQSADFTNVIRFCELELIERLIAAGMPVDEINLVLAACERGDLVVLERLLAAGADISGATRDGVTPLMVAAWNGHLPVVERLLAAGADVATRTKRGDTAVTFAQQAGRVDVADFLLQQGSRKNVAQLQGGSRGSERVRSPSVTDPFVYAERDLDKWPVRIGPFAPEVDRTLITSISLPAGAQSVYSTSAPRSELSSRVGTGHWAVASLVVEPDGTATSIQVVGAESIGFASEVARAFGTCRYRPGIRSGKAVRARILEVVTIDE